jgi:hypothetical protein
MKESSFAIFLNRLGHIRAKYGGVLVKKTEEDGELKLHLPQWLDMISDQVHAMADAAIATSDVSRNFSALDRLSRSHPLVICGRKALRASRIRRTWFGIRLSNVPRCLRSFFHKISYAAVMLDEVRLAATGFSRQTAR